MPSLDQLAQILLLILGLIAIVLLFWGGPGYYDPRYWKQAWNTGHILLFSIWTYLFLRHSIKPWQWSWRTRFIGVLCLVLLTGSVIEGIQFIFGRSFSYQDMFHNITGSLLILAFYRPMSQTSPKLTRKSVQCLTILVLCFSLTPLGMALTDKAIANIQYPTLSDFETPLESSRWRGDALREIVHTRSAQAQNSMRIIFSPPDSNNVSLHYFPSEWNNYRFLQFSVFQDKEQSVRLRCKIFDRTHLNNNLRTGDRFEKEFKLKKGWNNLQVSLEKVKNAPDNRKMVMDELICFQLFVPGLDQKVVLFLDNLRLEDPKTALISTLKENGHASK